jgi:hypothetical protein
VSRLFIDIYLAEDVNVLVADLLRARGFIAVTTAGSSARGASLGEADASGLLASSPASGTPGDGLRFIHAFRDSYGFAARRPKRGPLA